VPTPTPAPTPAPTPTPTPTPTPSSGWVAGSYLPASTYAAQCVNPRAGVNPLTSQPYNDIPGTVLTENN
jgi:hypothetical protein